jgi:hypothetical protein
MNAIVPIIVLQQALSLAESTHGKPDLVDSLKRAISKELWRRAQYHDLVFAMRHRTLVRYKTKAMLEPRAGLLNVIGAEDGSGRNFNLVVSDAERNESVSVFFSEVSEEISIWV